MRRSGFFLSSLFFLLAAAVASAVEIVDDRGTTIHLDRPAQRVIALAPHLTELVFAAGAGNRLVGVVYGSDFPPEARMIAQIGDAAGIDFERIVALQPDVVLAWGSGNRVSDVQRLERMGFAVLVLEPRRLEDIPRHLRLLGESMATGDRARMAASEFVARQDSLRSRYQNVKPVSVLFEAWHRPLITVNGEHIISDVLRLCGGRNAFADFPLLAGPVSLEQVLARDPDAIVVGSEAPEQGEWSRYPKLRAVQGNRIFRVPADEITRQTPRILDAAARICADLDLVRATEP